ncbi:MAG: UDP-2,4-diacetamido-2,4,6-trideoxy-beta-L-altropyranose hydrolase [Bacteroidales bacterium]|nr:UDP-2,4-diacetamido-2,4,6-trideoxy-beta-L-altropyranose hydrolase [Bacteroidales bacterium]
MILKTLVYIRADGNEKIGLGHLVRCLALAQMIKAEYNITFFCHSIPNIFENELRDGGFKLARIVNEDEFINLVTHDNIVILDGYNFSTDYQKTIKKKGAKLICIDDLHNKVFFADLIINYTPGIVPKDYKAQPYTIFALGLNYVLLRQNFLAQTKKTRYFKNSGVVFICFGGADPKELTIKTLRFVSELQKFEKIIVVTGIAFNKTSKFVQLLLTDKRIDHRQNLNAKQMLDAFLEANIAIVPTSSLFFEALASGCKVISGITVENQRHVYENCRKAKIFFDAGLFSIIELGKAIKEALMTPLKSKKIINGGSKERILKLIDQLNNELIITLRDVRKEDLEITHKWASNIKVRQYSLNRHQISFTEHTNWFSEKLGNPFCFYYIAEYKGTPIGSVRFDIISDESLISYLIDPDYHGKGFGQILLKKGIERFLEDYLIPFCKIKVISGEVLKSNIPSIKSFERLGFNKSDLGNKYKYEKQL